MKEVLVHFAPALLHSSTGDVGAEGRAEAVGDEEALPWVATGEASELTRAGGGQDGHEFKPERRRCRERR
ncbi:hypothetical protein N7462_010726 [Penicillium macrosclerotiorum]|uniref:uncharacterized protein n=1 Tax=Penicillium macrosclerotiorum TaxID=303699 RepID=UPI00254699B1|nr:uncharacterized protein N7462_010726 [Penicillium macrosclerotiorum]KAJ5669656.1 hypothetical protein N7462_010726 [Penicillium macrosclerotiorum]